MSYRILTKNAVENTNIDGARDHNFNAGRRSGIVKGALNSGNLFLSANNTIALDTCELRLCGHRVVIDSAEYKTFYNQPSVPIRYSLVAQIIVSNNGESVSFDLKTQSSTTPLVQNDLDKNINGTYELEIGRFTQLTDGTLTDVVRTADLITGGGNNDSEYIRIGTVTTNKISPELDADVDIENTINPDDNKPQTNFTFNLPTSVGTVVSVNGEEKTSINTDITPIASSENLITSGGVHDYPAVTFAESERQKSKNLFKVNNVAGYSTTRNGVTATINNDYTITLNGTCTANTYFNLFNGINNGSTFSADYAKLYLDINKNYSYVLKQLSGSYSGTSTYNQIFGVSLRQTDGSAVVSGKSVELLILVTGVNNTYVNKSSIDYLNNGYFRTTKGLTYDNFTFGLMICEGEDSDFQSWNGAIVHEKQIADVEHIETIYDKNSSDANINKGYRSGLQFSGTTAYNIMEQPQKNKYKCFRATAHLVNTDLIFEFMNNVDGYARGGFSCQAQWLDNSQICAGHISIAPWGIIPLSNCIIQSGSTVTSKRDDTSYYISKIEGVLL